MPDLLQSLESLNKANEVRIARANDKKAINKGQLYAATIVRNPPPHWRSAKLYELLLSMNQVGRKRAQRWCRLEFISLNTPVGELTERQRTILARHIDVWASRRDDLRRFLEEHAA